MYETNNPWHQPNKEWVYAPTWRTMESVPRDRPVILTNGVDAVKAYYSGFD